MEPEELWIVCNILVDDDSLDIEFGQSYADYFQVNWDGKPLRIPPGDTAVVPRYLADHFAKHLADYILARDKEMMHDENIRNPIISRIILRKADEIDKPDGYIPGSYRADKTPTEGEFYPEIPNSESSGSEVPKRSGEPEAIHPDFESEEGTGPINPESPITSAGKEQSPGNHHHRKRNSHKGNHSKHFKARK